MRSIDKGRLAAHARTGWRAFSRSWSVAVCLVISAGCGAKSPPEHRFYDEHIQPIFNTFCVGNTSP